MRDQTVSIQVKPHDVVSCVDGIIKSVSKVERSITGTEKEFYAYTYDELKAIGEMLVSYSDCYRDKK